MTELEIMKRAKQYIDALANGTDPLSGRPVQSVDVVNQVRISRCIMITYRKSEPISLNGSLFYNYSVIHIMLMTFLISFVGFFNWLAKSSTSSTVTLFARFLPSPPSYTYSPAEYS